MLTKKGEKEGIDQEEDHENDDDHDDSRLDPGGALFVLPKTDRLEAAGAQVAHKTLL